MEIKGELKVGNKLTADGSAKLKEQASADADVEAYGQLWVKTATPNELWFTDDAGTDVQLGVDGTPTLDNAYTNGRTIVMDLDEIIFDVNDATNGIFAFDIDLAVAKTENIDETGWVVDFPFGNDIIFSDGDPAGYADGDHYVKVTSGTQSGKIFKITAVGGSTPNWLITCDKAHGTSATDTFNVINFTQITLDDKMKWDEDIVFQAGYDEITGIGWDVNIEWDINALADTDTCELTYTWLDLDFTKDFGLQLTADTVNLTIFDLNFQAGGQSGTRLFANWKTSGATKFSVDHLGNTIIAGTLDVDGTTNLDGVDIDGNVDLDGTLTMGESDTGYDLKAWGDTAARFMEWDASADTLNVAGDITNTLGTITASASTTTYASINIPAGTAPTSPVKGDIWYCDTQEAIFGQIANDTQALVGHLYSTTANSNAITSTSKTAFSQTYTFPADFFTIGKTVKVLAFGYYETNVAETNTISAALGAVEIASTVADFVVPDTNNTNVGWFMELIMTCRTVGASGTIMTQGRCVLSPQARVGGTYADFVNTATDTVDTTGTLQLILYNDWDQSGSTIRITNLCVEALN